MHDTLRDRIAGLLYGSLAGDALALGAHWIYDQEELRRDFGRVSDYLDPRADSYHPAKRRGQQTHYGDQALTLMGSLPARGGFDFEAFARDWRQMWNGYPDYFDHATKDTLANLASGTPPRGAASTSTELGGAARIAPLLAAMAGEPVADAVDAARAQTGLTHGSKIAGDAAAFLTRLVFALLGGAGMDAAVGQAAGAAYDELDFAEIRQRVAAARRVSIGAAAESLGLACPTAQSLPTVLMLLDRCGDDFEDALIENTMAGGDNAARGLALGLVLGAKVGQAGIPKRWQLELEAAPRVEAFLENLTTVS
jgi:ADP-ribosylglycohydrolase